MDHYYIFNAQVSNLIDQNRKCNNQQKEECTTPKVFSFVFLLQHYFFLLFRSMQRFSFVSEDFYNLKNMNSIFNTMKDISQL